MTDARSKSHTDSSLSSESEDVLRAQSRSKKSGREIKKPQSRKLTTANLLDSNGESEDEEINRLQKVIQDQAKELNDEKLASRKLKQMVKLLKRETKQLQDDKQRRDGQSNASDSDQQPPWERRKLEARLSESEKVIREKNAHIEQLLRDCRLMEQDVQQSSSQINQLTQQFDECTQQLKLATHNYETLQETYQERMAQLEKENETIRSQLSQCQWQKEKTEENLDKISEAVDLSIDRCKEIITNKERTIESLQGKLEMYQYSGLSSRENEIERLRAELAAASKEMEESARLMERFQGLHSDKGGLTGSVKRKLKELETLKTTCRDNERLLTEREQQVAELMRTISRYESGTFGLHEATKELKQASDQLKIRDEHIEQLVRQLNTLEERFEDVVLENSHLREKYNLEPKEFDLTAVRMTLNQQRDACQLELNKLKEENMRLELENRSYKRNNLLKQDKPSTAVSHQRPSVDKPELEDEYQKACSEVIVLRKGLIEILHSVRLQDGTSDVKIESPILERLVNVLNCERLFGHYDAYADIMNENSSLYDENKVLKEKLRQINSTPVVESPPPRVDRRDCDTILKINQSVQVSLVATLVDRGNDADTFVEVADKAKPPVESSSSPKRLDRHPTAHYENLLADLELELDKVKKELDHLTGKHQVALSEWKRRETSWINDIAQKEKRLEHLERELMDKDKMISDLSAVAETRTTESPGSVQVTDEIHMRMEKELVTLKIRLEHKEQTLKRSHQFLDEIRLEQLKMIEDHSQEVLNLQDTILEQQRALHRVEQTQREMAATAASSRAVVRHLETEADSTHQLHSQISDLVSQLETVRKQAAQWKQAAEILSQEKQTYKDSLSVEHRLVAEQLTSQLEDCRLELKEEREKSADLLRQLNEERFDKQRSTLLQVLVAKLKTELDKKEKQMDFLKQLAEEMHNKLDEAKPLVTSTPVPPTTISITLPTPAPIEQVVHQQETSDSTADMEQQFTQLEKTADALRKQLEASRSREKSLKEALKEQKTLTDKLQNDKANLSRQMVSLRNRVSRMSSEKIAASQQPEDVCRLLKRIKELEAQLDMFHTAEKPTNEESLVSAKAIAMDQWKERKRLQTVIDHLKVKSKDLQDRILEDERQNESLRKTVNRLVNEKRVLEDKLKYKANDNERIHRLVDENTQWRIRFEGLEQRLREMSEEDTNTDRHRLQISVLQERIRKQEKEMAQWRNKSPTPSQSLSEEIVAKINYANMVETKLRENIQRLANLVQIPRRSKDGEKRIMFQEGAPLPDIRRTVKTLQDLVNAKIE